MIPLDPADSRSLVLERCSPLALALEEPGHPASLPSAMEQLRHRRDFGRQSLTNGVAAIESLLQDPDARPELIHLCLSAVNSRNEETKALDQRVQETIDLDELDADFFTSYKYHEKVTLIRSHVSFARPSAAPSLVSVQSTGAPSLDFAVTRHGKTAVLPGDSKRTVEADKAANVHAACEPCVSDMTASENSYHA